MFTVLRNTKLLYYTKDRLRNKSTCHFSVNEFIMIAVAELSRMTETAGYGETCTLIPAPGEAWAGKFLSWRPVWFTSRVPGQSGIYSETLSQ